MYRYTTPTIPITIEDLDFDTVDLFRVKFKSGSDEELFIISADDPRVDADNKTITIELTQEQTAALSTGFAEMQVRIRFTNGRVQATPIVKVSVQDVLDRVVI